MAFLKKAVLSTMLILSILASSLMAAVPAAAAGTATMSIDPASQNVVNGATDIVVNLKVDSQIATRSWGAKVHFDPAQLTLTSATYGTAYYTNTYYADQLYSLGLGSLTDENTSGDITLAQACMGMPSPAPVPAGPSGVGTLITLHFSADVTNVIAPITFYTAPALTGMGDVSSQPVTMTLVDGSVTIGNPPAADLTVSNVDTAFVSGGTDENLDPAVYSVSFQVNNAGNLNAGATTAWVVVDSKDPILVSVGAINAGANSGTLSAGNITLTGSGDSIVITADATAAILESNEANNAVSTSYSFVYAVGQGTDVYGAIVGNISFTQPETVNMGNMAIGPNSQITNLNVKSNQSWTITTLGQAPTVSGDANANINAGKMTKLTGSVYNAYIKLHRQLHVITTGGYLTPYQVGPSEFIVPTNADVTLTGTAQTLAFGIAEGQVTSTDGLSTLGEDRVLTFSQTLQANDPSLANGSIWDIPVAFEASATGF